jgi:RHS repeat-associated protein
MLLCSVTGLAPSAWSACSSDLAAELPDVVLDGEIRAKASELGFDAVRIYEFVRNEVEYTPYYGLRKGPVGTLRSGSGNEYDISALLVSLLRTSEDLDGDCALDPGEDQNGSARLDGGTPARFVRGRIRVTHEEARAWTGAREDADPLTENGALGVWHATEPWAAGQPDAAADSQGGIEKLHVWVEAEVPIAQYRGVGASVDGRAWLPLDATFKKRDWKRDPIVSFGPGADVNFDFDGFYSSVKQELPGEALESSIRTHLNSAPAGGAGAGRTVLDVDFRGPILPVAPGVLPNALPYQVLATPPARRAESLIPLHQLTPQQISEGWSSSSGVGGINDYRTFWILRLCATPGANGQCVATSSIIAAYAETAAVEAGRVALVYPPSASPPPPPNQSGYVSCSSTPPHPQVQVQPSLRLDGEEFATGALQALCAPQTVSILLVDPRPENEDSLFKDYGNYSVIAGGTYVFALDAGSASSSATSAAAEQLLDSADQYSVVIPTDPNGIPTVDGDAFGLDFEAQEALVGGLLELVGSRHLELARASYARIYALHHEIPLQLPWAGLVEAIPVVAFTESAPFLIRPNTLAIDIKGYVGQSIDRTTGLPLSLFEHASSGPSFSRAAGVVVAQISALEHTVWEELANAEAISTVKSFQIRSEQAAALAGGTPQPPMSVKSTADVNAMTASCNNTELRLPWAMITSSPNPEQLIEYYSRVYVCSDIDADTYCKLKDQWAETYYLNLAPKVCDSQFPDPENCVYVPMGLGAQWRAFYWDKYECPCARNGGTGCVTDATITQVETRISKKSRITDYFGWTGHAWEERYTRSTPGQPVGEAIGFAVERDFSVAPAGGGYLLDYDFFDCVDDLLACDSLSLDLDPIILDFNLALNNITTRGDPVSVVTGNLQHTEVDLTIPARGGSGLQLKRSYNSRLAYPGPLGYGWVHTYDQHLRFAPGDAGTADDRIVFVDDDGNETPFEDPSPGSAVFLDGPDSYHSTLERKSDGTFELVTKEGIVFRFGVMSADRANLASIQDRNLNTTTLTYVDDKLSTVSDPADRGFLTFSYASDGAGGTNTSVTDWSSPPRTWRYRVDAAGDLISYKDPEQMAAGASGEAVIYGYYQAADGPGVAHNLRCMVMPEDRGDGGGFDQLCGAAAAGRVWTHFVYYANDAVYEHTTSLGETTRFFYDYFRRRTTVTYPDGAEEAYIFDRVGNTTRSESPRGVIHEYVYADGTRNRTEEYDGFGKKTLAEYEAKGNVTRRVDRLDHEERWTYDAFSQPLTHIDRRGNQREWRYDLRGNLYEEVAEIDGQLQVLARHVYDGHGNRTATTIFSEPGERGARTTTYTYSGNGADLLMVTDAMGHATRITNDAVGRPTRAATERKAAGGRVETLAVGIQYDRLDRAVRTTDPSGINAEVVFDADGNVTEQREVAPPSGEPVPVQEISRSYDDGGRLVHVTEDGLTATTEYDARGRPTRVTSPGGNVSTSEYDLDGNLVRVVDPTGAATSFEYDGDNRLLRTRDALGRESRVVHDAEGRVVERWAPNDRLVETTVYDEEGVATDTWDAANRHTTMSFDELGRMRTVTALAATADAATTTFSHDLTGALLARTDPNAHQTRFSYDALGRMVETIDPLGRRSGHAYDDVGDLVEVVNGAGERLRLEYDVRGGLTRRTGPGVDDSFAYDGLGRLRVARNAESTLTYEYDSLGRVIAVSDPARFGTLRQSYDFDGRVKQLVYPTHATNGFPDGVVTNFEYDGRGQLTAVLDPAGVWQFQYDALGRLASQRSPTGEMRKVSYTPEGWIDRVEFALPGSGSETIQYGNYDLVGQPRAITTGESATATAITYHPRGWAQAVTYPDATVESFTYDKVGNRVQHQPRSGAAVVYEHDAADQLTRIRTPSNTTLETFSYDRAGRRTGRTVAAGATTTNYGYDALGRLIAVSTPSASYALALFYDAAGARTRRTETGQSEALYLGGFVERRQNVNYRLVRAPGASGPLGEVALPILWTLLRDGSGNVTKVAYNGSTTATRRYELFGSLRSGAIGNLERAFAGLPREGSSGLYYASARHYDPLTGRFLQPEPAGLLQPNLYAYAVNNPVMFSDPSGLEGMLSLSGFPDWLSGDSLLSGAAAPSYMQQFGSGAFGAFTGIFTGAMDFVQAAEVGDARYFENLAYSTLGNAMMLGELAFPTPGPAGLRYRSRVYDELAQPETHGALFTSALIGAATGRIVSGGVGLRAGSSLMEHPFASGGSHITTTRQLGQFPGSSTFGGPGGLFISPSSQIDRLLGSARSRGDIELGLGLRGGSLEGGSLVRIDLTNPFERNLRQPTSGNLHFRPGTGLTTGGLYEGLIDSPLKSDPNLIFRILRD